MVILADVLLIPSMQWSFIMEGCHFNQVTLHFKKCLLWLSDASPRSRICQCVPTEKTLPPQRMKSWSCRRDKLNLTTSKKNGEPSPLEVLHSSFFGFSPHLLWCFCVAGTAWGKKGASFPLPLHCVSPSSFLSSSNDQIILALNNSQIVLRCLRRVAHIPLILTHPMP